MSTNRGYKKVHDERKRKQKREKERKRERRRDKNDLEFVPVGVIPVTGQTWTRRELSFHSVTRLGSDGMKRNNSSLWRARHGDSSVYSMYTLLFHHGGDVPRSSGWKTWKNWLPELAAVIVATTAAACYLFPFRSNVPWKTGPTKLRRAA